MNVARKASEREGALGCLREREKEEKSPHSPPVLCRTFSFDPPLLFLLPSTSHTYTHFHTHTQANRSAGYSSRQPFISTTVLF